jgi:hypothetical protein
MKVWKNLLANFSSSFIYRLNTLKGLAYNEVPILGVQSMVFPYFVLKN